MPILLHHLPSSQKLFVTVFLFVLSIGYFTGMSFVRTTTSLNTSGIIENYNGNEQDEGAEEMKFKKSDREILTIVHTHVLSLSVLFFITGVLVFCTGSSPIIKSTLAIEPLLSVLVTFGGIYGIWSGYTWMVYIVMVSGLLMTISYMGQIVIIIYDLYFRKPTHLQGVV